MENKKLLIIVIVVAVIGGLGALSYINKDTSQDSDSSETSLASQSTNAAMHEEYPNVPEENRYIKESFEQIMDRFDSGSGIIFLGFKECPWCQKMAPMLNEVAEEEDQRIYYLDIKRLYDESPYEYAEILELLTPYLEKDDNDQPRISTPDISFVKDGEIIWRYKMDTVSEIERTPEIYWTDERKDHITRTLHEEMKKLKEV